MGSSKNHKEKDRDREHKRKKHKRSRSRSKSREKKRSRRDRSPDDRNRRDREVIVDNDYDYESELRDQYLEMGHYSPPRRSKEIYPKEEQGKFCNCVIVGRILSIAMIGGLPCAVLSIDILPGI